MRVTIVGGGSYQWTPELMADLFGTASLRGMELVLHDIDPAPLVSMAALSHRLDEALSCGARISTTTDRRTALDHADFVIVTISTGGFESMAFDLDVPARHGIRQAVGDSVGPGGISRALRNIPVLVDIARDMEELCPDAWLLNITNPMTCLTRAVLRETSIKAVGLCHEVGNWCLDLAIAMGVAAETVRPTVAGVNHLPIVTALSVGDRDGFEALREFVADAGGLDALAPVPDRVAAAPFTPLDFVRRHTLALTLLDQWGAVPAAGDRHVAEFLPGVLTETTHWGADYNIALTSIADRRRDQAGFVADVESWLAGTKQLQTWSSGELPALVIDSLVTGDRRELPLNLPNSGQCPDAPRDAVVESICVVDADGIRPRDVVELPPRCAELVRRHVAVQELTVSAAITGDRELVAAAFALDPLAGRGDPRTTEAMADELLAATAGWLPQFD